MKRFKIVSVIIIVSILLAIVIACNPTATATGGGGATDPEAAAAYVDDAIADLENEDFDTALSDFSKAVLNDPANGQALLGYALMEVMSITVDPGMVSLAHNNLGLADYPSNMNDLIEGTWIVCTDYQDSDSNWQEFYAPVITGEEAWADFSDDPDNPTDVVINEEKGMAAISFFVQHNTGFNELVNGMSTVFEDRINSALNVIDSIPADTEIVFPGEATGIKDNDGNYQDLVVGKAEANILAAYLLAFRSQVRMGQVYDYELPDLNGYFNSIILNIINGDDPDFTDVPTPFSGTFLEPSTEAFAKLAAAKADMRSMISRLTGALNTIKNRTGSTFSFSPESTLVIGQNDVADIWDNIETGINFADTLFTKIDNSLAAGGGTVAYIPIIDMNYFSGPVEWMEYCLTPGNWPVATNLDTAPYYSVGIDYGAFYASPLMAINAIFDLNSAGEPVFYKWDGNGGFVSTTDPPTLDYSSNTSDDFYYVKIKDISFGGTISTSLIPRDVKGTEPFRISGFYWHDDNLDGYYNIGEVGDINVSADIEGVIDINDWSTEEPAAYYWPINVDFTNTTHFPDTLFSDAGIATDNSGNYDTLRTALDGMDFQGVRFNAPVSVLDGTAVYLAIPKEGNFVVWHSLTPAGTTVTVDGTLYTSTGSFWWGLASMATMFE